MRSIVNRLMHNQPPDRVVLPLAASQCKASTQTFDLQAIWPFALPDAAISTQLHWPGDCRRAINGGRAAQPGLRPPHVFPARSGQGASDITHAVPLLAGRIGNSRGEGPRLGQWVNSRARG